jgi:hypothetical protein
MSRASRHLHPQPGGGEDDPGSERPNAMAAGGGAPRARSGWYAYRAVATAELPTWAVEIALTVERPAQPEPDGLEDRTEAAGRPTQPDPDGPGRSMPVSPPTPPNAGIMGGASRTADGLGSSDVAGASRTADGLGSSGSQAADGPTGKAQEPTRAEAGSARRRSHRSHTADAPDSPDPGGAGGGTWTVEGSGRPGTAREGGHARAVLLLRAPARSRLLTGLAEAAAEVEAAAGLWPVIGPSLLAGRALPGLRPVLPAAALAQLEAAGTRGLPAPLRRRQPAVGWIEAVWRSSVGAVITCDGPCGTSAQAVIALRGPGSGAGIVPPPGGALVLRAWRSRGTWGLACGLVLGSAEALGLGREAGQAAARARAEGWNAAVLSGSTALDLARAGNPIHPAPVAAAHAASRAQVASMIEVCLSAGGIDDPTAGSLGTLAVTP